MIDKSILSLAFRANAVDGIETGIVTVVGGYIRCYKNK